jgi:hypothetical protein
VLGRRTGSITDYRLDVVYDNYPFEASWSLYYDLASGLNEVTDFGICRRSMLAWCLATSTSL